MLKNTPRFLKSVSKLNFGENMFRLLPAFRSVALYHSTSIAPIVRSAWHLPMRKNVFLSQPKNYRRFFSTVANTTQDDFKSDFSTFLKEKIENSHNEIKDEAIKTEVKSFYEALIKGMQKNITEQPDFVKIIHKNMGEIVKGHDIISIPIRKFSNQAMSAFFEQLDNHGYAASVSWLSEVLNGHWVINNTEIVLSFCKKIPGITDREMPSRIPLSAEEHGRAFR